VLCQYVAGAWTTGSVDTAGVINPFDASVEVVDQAGPDDLERAVAGARAPFDSGPWRATSVPERGAVAGRRAALRPGLDQRLPPVHTRSGAGGMERSGNDCELDLTGLAEHQEAERIWHNTAPAPQGWFSR
jgi:hypothetical protein